MMTTPLRALPALVGAGLLCVTVFAGCTGDAETKPTGSGASSASPSVSTSAASGSAAFGDRSREVLAAPPTLSPLATTKSRSTSSFRGSSFTFYRISRTDSSTIVVYTVTGGTGFSSPSDSLPAGWENAPTMLTPTHAYRVVTAQDEFQDWEAVANPAFSIDPGEETGPLYMLYPPLPKGTTSVTLSGPWFEDVTVPVTDVSTP